MGICQGQGHLQGHPDMYGLGVRLAFYFQWFGKVLVEYDDEPEVADIRILGLLLSGAITIGLVIQAARGQIQPADMYIVLLLAAGTYVFLIPIYIWRLLTCCNPIWDPLRWTRKVHMPVYDFLNFMLLLTVASLGVWCFATYLPGTGRSCEQYGFLFTMIRLDSAAFMVINIVMYVLIIVTCIGVLLARAGYWDGQRGPRERRRRHRRIHRAQRKLLRIMRGLSNITVYGLHITAIELTVRWNQLDNVDAVNTNAQIIPLLVSAGIILRIVFSHYYLGDDDSEESSTTEMAAPAAPVPPEPQPPDPPEPQPLVTPAAAAAGLPIGGDEYWLARMEAANRVAEAIQAAREDRELRELFAADGVVTV